MKKILYTLLFVILFLCGCGKDNDFLFEMPYQADFVIPAGLSHLNTWVFELNDIPTNTDIIFDANNFDAANVSSINPAAGRMFVTFSNTDFDFIREVSVEIYDDNTGLEKEIFFTLQLPPDVGDRIDLAGTLVDAKDFLLSDRFNIRVRLKLRGIPAQSIESRIDFSFGVR